MTSPSLVSNPRLLVDAMTSLVLMVGHVGFLSPTTIPVCSMVELVKAKLPLSNGYPNSCKFIALICATIMYLWTKVVSFMVIPIFLTCLLIITIKSILLGPLLPIKIVQLSLLIVSLVTMFVPFSLVSNLIPSFGLLHIFITSVSTTRWK